MAEFTVDEAVAFATEAHRGQRDKAGDDYITHPLRVMDGVDSEEAKMAAVLHDVLEDTDVSEDDLRARGVPTRVFEALCVLRHDEGVPDEEYWARVAAVPLARQVKLADIADNSDERRLARLDQHTADRLRDKYRRARAALGPGGGQVRPSL